MGITIKANFDAVSDLAKGIENAAEIIGAVAVSAVNTVANATFIRSKVAITSQVALPQEYVDQRMFFKQATDAWPTATISARTRATTLARYNSKQVMTVAKRPGRAKGDPLRNIPAGMKSAGVSVNVKAGKARATIQHAFLIPLRAGNVDGGNGMGVFTRTGKGRDDIRNRYGPSVDQVFNGVIKKQEVSVADELQATMVQEMEAQLQKSMDKK